MKKPIDYQGFTPSRWMSRWVVCGVALFFAACSVDPAERPEPQIQTEAATRAQVDAMAQVRALAVENAVYHEATDSWIAEQGDPYRLDNFQKAYDKLSRTTKGFEKTKKLQATHYALKIYPKTEEEQNRIESDKEVQVAYVPFDHIQLTEAEVARKVRSKTATTFGEKSPYSVTYEITEATDGGPTGPVTVQLPILYVVWPVEKPLPTDIEYTIDYEVFLPRASAEEAVTLQALETQALGGPRPPITMQNVTFWPVAYDNILGYVPLNNLRVREQNGSNIYDTVTSAAGACRLYGLSGTVSLIYQDIYNRWKITPDNDMTVAYTVNLGLCSTLFPQSNPPKEDYEIIINETRQENSIHRAVNYFFNTQNYFQPNLPESYRIVASNNPGGAVSGKMVCMVYFDAAGSVTSCDSFIVVYNDYDKSSIVGTTLHELGHSTHLYNNPMYYLDSPQFLRESLSSYFGWYLGEDYYREMGWVKTSGSQDITSQSRQDWTKNTNSLGGSGLTQYNYGWYSPLFIDLADTYNQRTQGTIYPNDTISGVPVSVIWSVISTSQSWAQCKTKLQNYVGVYYTAAQYNGWIADFDYWMATYN